MTTLARDHSLDAARGVLMVMGILLHASNIYSAAGDWIIADPQTSTAFDMLSMAIHVFRMPAFFWIAGYFVALTYERAGWEGLLRKRVARLAVPLVSTWLTFNVVQEMLVASHNGAPALGAVRDGVPLSHLWFLVDLIVFIALAALLLPRMAQARGSVARDWLHGLKGQILVLAISSYVVLLLVRATGMAYVSPLGLTSPYRLATYAPYFAAGIFMYRSPRARAVFLQAPPALLLVSVPLALISELHEPDYGRLLYEATEFLSMLGSWMSVAAVLSLFRRIFSAESPLTRFLSEASYSIYLFHHVIVIALGIALIPVSLPLPVKFLAICAVTFLATVSMHVLIVRRLPVVRFLFNGKR